MSTPHAKPPTGAWPSFVEESRLWASGHQRIAGLDEAGRGALAGPVVAGAVIVPPGQALAGVWAEVRDSKLLLPATRRRLAEAIQIEALAWGVGIVGAAVIDEIGIAAATRQAMMQAISTCGERPDYLLIDWVKLPQSALPQLCVAKADQRIASVAAASILAKVTRDQIMVEMAQDFPNYAFHAHKGYGSGRHLAAISEHGPCPQHRLSFAPMARNTTLSDVEK